MLKGLEITKKYHGLKCLWYFLNAMRIAGKLHIDFTLMKINTQSFFSSNSKNVFHLNMLKNVHLYLFHSRYIFYQIS